MPTEESSGDKGCRPFPILEVYYQTLLEEPPPPGHPIAIVLNRLAVI